MYLKALLTYQNPPLENLPGASIHFVLVPILASEKMDFRDF